MPKAKRPRSNHRTRRPFKRFKRNARVGRARPMRALKNSYRATNIYRFVRETMPTSQSVTLIPQGAGTYNAIGYLQFENLQMNQLVGWSDDFAGLFARYKIDKIVTKLQPMWAEGTQTTTDTSTTTPYGFSPECEVTRVNTKWLSEPYVIGATAQAQLEELAQLQSKTVSTYSSKRPMYIVTKDPGTYGTILTDPTDVTTVKAIRRKGMWMDMLDHSTATFPHNSICFLKRIDGGAIDRNWKYHVTHKIYFRCTQVG